MEPDIAGIERRLWAIADRVRATTPLYDYFSFILSLIFLRLTDHRYAQATAGTGDPAQTPLDRAACHQRGCYFVPAQARFSHLLSLPPNEDALRAVTSAMRLLEEENDGLRGVLTTTRWRIESHAIFELLHTINSIPLDGDGAVLTVVFDSCLRHAAVSDSRIDFATPNEVNGLLIRLAKPQRGMSVYDPCAGFGGILLEAARFVSGGNVTGSELSLFGQEVNNESLAICKMRLLLSGYKSADLRLGSSLTHPQHLDGDRLRTFDRVVSNPPFSLSPWHHGDAGHDPYHRYRFGTPPRNSGDYAFLQHMIASTAATGSVAALVAQGVLFRGGSEGRIRQGIVEADLVEAVIALPPGVLYGTDVSAAVLVLNKNKPADRKGKTLFIDASRDFVRQGRRNCLSANDVSRIAGTFDAYADVERYARVVGLDETDAVADAVEQVIVNDDLKRRFLVLARQVLKLYKAILPDPRSNEFIATRACFAVLVEKVRAFTPGEVTIAHVMERVDDLLDQSIATKGYVIHATEEPSVLDLSEIDFDKLREWFEKSRKRAAAEKVRQSVEQQLQRMVRENKSRADLLDRFKKLIDEYNAGLDVESMFQRLVDFVMELNEEDKRGVAEQLSPEELAVFDILTKPDPVLQPPELAEVKKVARQLLITLKQAKLVLDWRKKQKARADVYTTIKEVLDELPRAYDPEVYQKKVDAVYQHVFESYGGEGKSLYVEA